MQSSASWRFPIIGLLGMAVISVSTTVYTYEQQFMNFVTPQRAQFYSQVAEVYLIVLTVGVLMVAGDLRRFASQRITEVRKRGLVPLSPTWLLPYVISLGKYRRYFAVSAILYGVFYAFITSMIVYQPTVDFVQEYQATLPSALIGPCCGPPLFTPVVAVYLVNHLGLLLIPLTVMLLLTISVLVGLNFAMAAFAFDSRAKEAGRGWVGGVGAVVGLFTGCPTCAGLFFANVFGGSAAVSFAALLAYYQPVFIVFSVPVLVATPYLTSRSLGKVFAEGCVYVRPAAA